MSRSQTTSDPVSLYIAGFPPEVAAVLTRIRRTVRAVAPQAEEGLSYRMPVVKHGGVLLYYAAFKSHIGLYPPVSGDPKLTAAAARYAGPKGNLRLPFCEPIPYGLIARIVRHRLRALGSKARTATTASRRRRSAAPRRKS